MKHTNLQTTKIKNSLLCLAYLGIVILSASCKKNNNLDDGLPPLTFEGKNTIGCKINGVPWVPKGISGPGGIQYPTSGGYYEDPFFFQNVHIQGEGRRTLPHISHLPNFFSGNQFSSC